jgi:ATP-dependent helicase/nuclease subunit B
MAKNCEVGKSHYDFVQLLSQKRVLITRAIKVANEITFKSRFLQRLESFLRCKNLSLGVNEEIINAVRFDNSIQERGSLAAQKPEPCFNIRNIGRISATNFNVLVKNPYDFYVNHVLKLKNTNVIENFNSRAILGSFFHNIFENFSSRNFSVEKMIEDFFYNNEILKKMYRKKILLVTKNFGIADEESRKCVAKVLAEQEYCCKLDGYDINLTARVDRLEFLDNGQVNVVDYKTATVPSKADMGTGVELQLPFTAFLMQQNGLKSNKIDVWSVRSDEVSHVIIDNDNKKYPLDQVIKNMEKFLRLALDNFSKEDSRFVATTLTKYSIYEHLSRVDEWVYGR